MKIGYRTGLILAFACLLAVPAHAQEAPAPYKNVISANPFGLLLTWFNAEYERVVGESSTIGVGGSTFEDGDDDVVDEDTRYVNADVFYRFYPSGRPLDGWAFGVKAGITDVTDAGTYAGFGFDVNRSWLLGKRDNFYVGIGFGLKRLIGVQDEDAVDLEFIPTIRIVNVGIAF
ncbi:MAG TPA: DUF3575 domain-containing protein [Longimicrobiales bacterium]